MTGRWHMPGDRGPEGGLMRGLRGAFLPSLALWLLVAALLVWLLR